MASGMHSSIDSREAAMSKFRSIVEGLKAPIKAVGDAVSSPFEALQKEDKLGPVLHAEVLAALKQVQSKHPDLKKVLDESAGFAGVREPRRLGSKEAPPPRRAGSGRPSRSPARPRTRRGSAPAPDRRTRSGARRLTFTDCQHRRCC